jgi:hypothetical protein
VLLKGYVRVRERAAANQRWVLTPGETPLMVVATGHFIGEGSDCPAIDTLFVAGTRSSRC